jgi:hypothetical protein
MRLQIRLTGGETLRADVELSRSAWNRLFAKAIRRGRFVEIEDANGEVLAINPRHVLFIRFGAARAHDRPELSSAPDGRLGTLRPTSRLGP